MTTTAPASRPDVHGASPRPQCILSAGGECHIGSRYGLTWQARGGLPQFAVAVPAARAHGSGVAANGARGGTGAGTQRAIFAYNHANWYVTDVLAWAAHYAAPAQTSASGTAAIAIAYAKAQLGKPYCWGGQGPSCFDCSGPVFAAYAPAGIHIARTTYQWQQDGPVIPMNQIQPGDLLFSAGPDGTRQNPGHVVMYLGNGQDIQAPQTGETVQIGPIDLASIVVATRPASIAR